MQGMVRLALGVLLAATGVAPAAATILDITYRGTVRALEDPNGVLGNPSAGPDFTLVFRADTNLGLFTGGGSGLASSTRLFGGTSQAGDLGFPTLAISPVSAMLTVNGRTLDFGGRYFGQVDTARNCFGVIFGGSCTSAIAQVATDLPAAGGDGADSSVQAGASTTFDARIFDLTQPLSWTIDGTVITGFGSFRYRDGAVGPITGSLDPVEVTVAAAAMPEARGWAMLILGFGMVGLVRRRGVRGGQPAAAV